MVVIRIVLQKKYVTWKLWAVDDRGLWVIYDLKKKDYFDKKEIIVYFLWIMNIVIYFRFRFSLARENLMWILESISALILLAGLYRIYCMSLIAKFFTCALLTWKARFKFGSVCRQMLCPWVDDNYWYSSCSSCAPVLFVLSMSRARLASRAATNIFRIQPWLDC